MQRLNEKKVIILEGDYIDLLTKKNISREIMIEAYGIRYLMHECND